jgi:hypothetical protein
VSLAATATEPTTLDQYVSLTEAKRELERELRMVKEQITPLQEQLLEEFAERGISGERHAASGKLVSITRRIWARARDGSSKHLAAEAMAKDPELSTFVELGWNTNSVSAYFRELATAQKDAGEPVTDLSTLVPVELRDVLELTEDHILSVRS